MVQMLVATYHLAKQKSICNLVHYGLALTQVFPSTSLSRPQFPCSLTKLCVQRYRYIFGFEVGRSSITRVSAVRNHEIGEYVPARFFSVLREGMRETKDERK
jgi:hypothetical protein